MSRARRRIVLAIADESLLLSHLLFSNHINRHWSWMLNEIRSAEEIVQEISFGAEEW